jgi:sugar fermentation stimulation protein A
MQLPFPLQGGRLIQRYKRFLADVKLDSGDVVTAHCPNPGSMIGLRSPGSRVWLSRSDNPKRKLAYTFELIEVDGLLVCINTGHPNAVAAEAISAGNISELSGYDSLRREVRFGENSRVDILLEDPTRGLCYVEIKSVTLKRDDGPNPGAAEFPDAVTKRGAKHLVELSNMVAQGHRAVMLYLVQRQDCDWFLLSEDIDPAYAAAFRQARALGVEAICYECQITTTEITVARSMNIDIGEAKIEETK